MVKEGDFCIKLSPRTTPNPIWKIESDVYMDIELNIDIYSNVSRMKNNFGNCIKYGNTFIQNLCNIRYVKM